MPGSIVLLLSAVFLLAAISKLRSRGEFIAVLRQLSPGFLVYPLSFAVPFLELLLAVCLLKVRTQRPALLATIACLILFTFILLELQRRGAKGCGCFGESDAELGPGVVRNVILSGLTAALLPQSAAISCFAPDLSSFVARLTVVLTAFCLWPCLVAIASLYKRTPV